MISYIFDYISGDIEFIDILIMLGSMCFVVFCATPLHEFAHALTAVKLGDDTPRVRGRLTINPMAHIDPLGAALIFLCGFGYAKPVEVRMRRFKKPKRDMALVAFAGPLCNLLQAFFCMIISNGILAFGASPTNKALIYTALFFFYAASINVNLAVFNLIPIPPLDGSRIATAILPSRIYYKIMKYERYITIGLFFLLVTNVLTKPLSLISGLVISGIDFVTALPFGLMG